MAATRDALAEERERIAETGKFRAVTLPLRTKTPSPAKTS